MLNVKIFQQGVPKALCHAAAHLAFKTDRIDHMPHIMRGGDVQQVGLTRADVHPHFRHLATIHPCEVRAAAAFFLIPVNRRRHKPAVFRQADASPFGFVDRVVKRNPLAIILFIDDKTVLPAGIFKPRRADGLTHDAQNTSLNLFCRVQNCPAAHHRPARGRCRSPVTNDRGRRFTKVNIAQRNPEGFCSDQRHGGL